MTFTMFNFVFLEIKPIKCPYCIKQFAQKKNFDRHVIIHTGERVSDPGKIAIPVA